MLGGVSVCEDLWHWFSWSESALLPEIPLVYFSFLLFCRSSRGGREMDRYFVTQRITGQACKLWFVEESLFAFHKFLSLRLSVKLGESLRWYLETWDLLCGRRAEKKRKIWEIRKESRLWFLLPEDRRPRLDAWIEDWSPRIESGNR